MKETDFYEFSKQLEEQLYQKLGRDVKIDIHETVKNNGVVYHAVAVLEKDCNISPNIRLDGYYHSYSEGIDIAKIAEDIADIYNRSRKGKIDVSFFTDFRKAKPNILLKVVGYEKNKERLKNIPHVKFLDLALTFYFNLEPEAAIGENASIQIENEHLKMWDIDMGKLYDLAMENTQQKLPPRCQNICDIIVDILKQEGIEPGTSVLDDFRTEAEALPMYVVSNRKNYFGASVICYPDVLKKMAQRLHSDLIILPSSVHEIILLPSDGKENVRELNDMIADINLHQVAEDEVLSDHLYYYDLERDELRMPPVC